MYNPKDTQFAGKHDYDKRSANGMADRYHSFSINIFQWQMKSSRKEMKKSRCVVRVFADRSNREKAFQEAEKIVLLLDAGKWDGRKTVKAK
jgi:hypothetical protein